MRNENCGMIEGISEKFTTKETLEMFSKVCLCRYFELNVKQMHEDGLIKIPIYLSVGQEIATSALSVAFKNPHIFAQHRCHDIYLAFGGNAEALIDELLHRSTGCAKGMGGSASIHSPEINMFGHDGLLGSQIPIAVGYALGAQKKVLAILGDGAAEEGYVLAAMGYAATKKLPILFICNDNNLSILTEVRMRRSWKIADIANSFGIRSIEIADDPWLVMHYVKMFENTLPAFINIHSTRVFWHAGTGTDGEPVQDRFSLVKEEISRLGLQAEAKNIEQESKNRLEKLFKKIIAKGEQNERS